MAQKKSLGVKIMKYKSNLFTRNQLVLQVVQNVQISF